MSFCKTLGRCGCGEDFRVFLKGLQCQQVVVVFWVFFSGVSICLILPAPWATKDTYRFATHSLWQSCVIFLFLSNGQLLVRLRASCNNTLILLWCVWRQFSACADGTILCSVCFNISNVVTSFCAAGIGVGEELHHWRNTRIIFFLQSRNPSKLAEYICSSCLWCLPTFWWGIEVEMLSRSVNLGWGLKMCGC